MAEVDRVEVKVTPDGLDQFRAKVTAELSKIRDIKVGVDPDTTGFRQKVQAELAGLRASVALDVDRDHLDRVAAGMTRAVRRESPAITRTVTRAMSEGVDEGFTRAVVDATKQEEDARRRVLGVERQIARTKDRLASLSREIARTHADDQRALTLLRREHEKYADAQRKLKIELEADRAGLARASAQLAVARQALQRQADANPVRQPVKVDLDRDMLRSTTSRLQSLTSGAFRFAGTTVGIAGIGIAASTAAGGLGAMLIQAVPLAAALGQASGAAMILPAALAGAGAAAATLVVGMQGVLTAFKDSGDPEKYAEALKDLTPAAQDFVKAGVGLKGILGEIRQEVQENLFQGLGDELRDWKTNLLPALKTGMGDLAGGLNDAMASVMKTLGSSKVAAALETLFGNTSKGFSAGASGLGGFTDGLIGLAAGGSVFFERMGRGFTDAGLRFSRWVDGIVADGRLEEWISRGAAALANLGSILYNVGSGLASIFRAAQAAGGDMLGRWAEATEGWAAWAKSADGQDSLTYFFRRVNEVTEALAPVGSALMTVVGSIASGAADIAVAFAPFARTVLENLSPAVDTLAGILSQAAPPFGRFLAEISQHIGPALEKFGPGVQKVFQALADSGPSIGAVLESLGSIGGAALETIARVIPHIASGLEWVAGGLEWMTEALGPVPAALAAFVAALAISSIGGGGKGGGLGFFGKLKGALTIGGAVAMFDAFSRGVPENGKQVGLQWAEGVAGGILAGGAVAGPVGAAVGAAVGTVVAFAPTYHKAGKTLANTLIEGLTGKEAGDNFKFSLERLLKNPLSGGLVTEIQGQGTNVTMRDNPEVHDRWIQSSRYYKALEELYRADYETAKKYDLGKVSTSQERARSLEAIERELARKQAEFAERGGTAQRDAADRSARAQEKAARQALAEWHSTSLGVAKAGPLMSGAMVRAANESKEAFVVSGASITSAMGVTVSNVIGGFMQAGSAARGQAGQSSSAWFSFGASAGSVIDAFYRKFNSRQPQDASAAQAQGARDAWSGMFGSGSSLGGNFGDGLVQGLRSRLSAVRSASAALANAARDAAILAARIASPSKVAIGIGEHWGEGLAVGIEQKAARVAAAARRTANAAAVGASAVDGIEPGGFPSVVTLVDRDGSILARTDVRAGRQIGQYDSSQSRVVQFGVRP